MRYNYEDTEKGEWEGAYSRERWGGVAWYVVGWETEPDEDTEWTGREARTGNLVVCMSGDDRYMVAEPEELKPLNEEDYCSGCGQIGCGHSLKKGQ